MKSKRECHYTRELDLEMLVWTRGPNFPLCSLDGGSCARVAERGGWQCSFNHPRLRMQQGCEMRLVDGRCSRPAWAVQSGED